jgi:hypothetical protein
LLLGPAGIAGRVSDSPAYYHALALEWFDAGDGLLVEFPSVVDAVRCGNATAAVASDHSSGMKGRLRENFSIRFSFATLLDAAG